jgi:hypothetical protein
MHLLWFSTCKVFFLVVIRALKGTWSTHLEYTVPVLTYIFPAHQFAAEERKILHWDVSPWNIWVFIKTWTQSKAVPSWDGGPPDLCLGLLGDWGLAIPMEGFEEVVPPSELTILKGDDNILYDAKQAVYNHTVCFITYSLCSPSADIHGWHLGHFAFHGDRAALG